VFLHSVVQKGVQAGGRVASCRGGVTRISLIVTFVRSREDLDRPFLSVGLLRFAEVSADLTSVEFSFSLVSPSFPPVPVIRILSCDIVTGAPRRVSFWLFHVVPLSSGASPGTVPSQYPPAATFCTVAGSGIVTGLSRSKAGRLPGSFCDVCRGHGHP
jgi:hypothetical protein